MWKICSEVFLLWGGFHNSWECGTLWHYLDSEQSASALWRFGAGGLAASLAFTHQIPLNYNDQKLLQTLTISHGTGVPNLWAEDTLCPISGSVRLEIKCTVSVVWLNHLETTSPTPDLWKNSPVKSIPGAKNVGDPLPWRAGIREQRFPWPSQLR